MSIHWVCEKCWGETHEEITIGGILPNFCAACGEALRVRETHAVQDEEFSQILDRIDHKLRRP